MKHKPRWRTLLPAMAILLSLTITINWGMLNNADVLDVVFGRGELHIISRDDAQEVNAEYYPLLYDSKRDALNAALVVSRQLSDEGTVLLKNDGLLPLSEDQAVSPLGLAYFEPLYGGSGSSAISTLDKDVITPAEGLHAAFSNVNATMVAAQQSALESDDGVMSIRAVAGDDADALREFSADALADAAPSLKGTVGVVYIARRSGEHQDPHTGAYTDGTPHSLALTGAEKSLIDLAKQHCAAVVVVICSASPMELACLEDDSGVSAILWQGGAGSTGYASIGEILVGRVNPSGRLPFTFAANFKADPTYANQDDGSERFTYVNAVTTQLTHSETTAGTAAFHEYEEGVYVGYRYYETAWAVGALDDFYDRQMGVVYPFGYGLSYADFQQEITDIRENGTGVEIAVRVTNLSDFHAGKEVVQLYCTAPYTELDAAYGIEKPAAVLVAFAKTETLGPGESQVIHLAFEREELASYCYTHDNGNGTTGCYMLEKGDYVLSLRADAHRVLRTADYHIPQTIWYTDGAVNQFDQMTEYMTDPAVSSAAILTRTDWSGTQPTAPTEKDRMASDVVAAWIAESDVTGEIALPEAEAVVSGAENGLVLADLRGVSYDDPLWDRLLDQLTYDDPELYRELLFEAGYQTGALPELQKPRSTEHDGPQGLTLADASGKNWLSGVCGYPAAPVMAATWNAELLYDMGAAVGQEALQQGITGWYAPGLNIQRSPFGGRASEYYSEDPLLAGCLGAQVVSGAGDNGLSCAIKHFCLMETEAHRSPSTCHWMTEQALREIYLRPFEIVVKEAEKTIRAIGEDGFTLQTMRACDFIMVSDSAAGTLWTGASAALLTDVLRDEWGFEGAVISDMHLNATSSMIRRMLMAGCDLLMSTENGASANFDAYDTPQGQSLIRRAVKNLCYTAVNSGLVQGISADSMIQYGTSPWQKALIAVDIVMGLLLAAGGILCLVDARDRRCP
nr:glycoside hydrolase family 3 protein [Clostridia bacterium]